MKLFFRLQISVLLMPLSFGMVFAQDGQPSIHWETPNQPPVPTRDLPTRTSPARLWRHGGFVSIQVNVDAMGNNIIGDAANETSIAVDPTNPDRMVIGWRQFDSIASDFRQAGFGTTDDGGQTWTTGVIESGVFRSDPVMGVDSSGAFFYNSLSVNGNDFFCTVFQSANGGATWDNGVFAQGGDKQWMAIDRTGGPGDGNIYAAWNIQFSTCAFDFTRSYDGGQNYLDCNEMPGNPRWGGMTVGPDGSVYVAGAGAEIVKSSTLQNPFMPPAFDFSQNVSLGGSTSSGTGPNPAGLLGQVDVETDHSDGPNAGNIYLLASVNPPGGDPLDVMFARSEDGGLTWSAPVRVNDDSGANTWQWFGMMSVAPNGRIDAVWNDSRAKPGTFISELFYAFSLDGGRNWSQNIQLSPSFDPHVGWPQQSKLGDYYDMVSDNQGVDLAYAATFNGEQDVYYLRIPHPLPPCREDLNGDGEISNADLMLAYLNWSNPGGPGDIDENGVVEVRDYVLIMNAFGSCL